MCLIGIMRLYNNHYILFKNRDLEYLPDLPGPKNMNDKGFRRIIFPTSSESDDAIWGGINEFGLSLQFADIYTNFMDESKLENEREVIRNIHCHALSNCKNADQACSFIIKEYRTNTFNSMILISDLELSIIIEATSKGLAMECLKDRGYLVRTHWPLLLSSFAPSVLKNRDHISALCRHQRATEMIEKTENWGVQLAKLILSDRACGDTSYSICRSGADEEYITRSSLIIEATNRKKNCHFVLNQSPTIDNFQHKEL